MIVANNTRQQEEHCSVSKICIFSWFVFSLFRSPKLIFVGKNCFLNRTDLKGVMLIEAPSVLTRLSCVSLYK